MATSDFKEDIVAPCTVTRSLVVHSRDYHAVTPLLARQHAALTGATTVLEPPVVVILRAILAIVAEGLLAVGTKPTIAAAVAVSA
jgi:hypothetical protein